MELCDLQGRKIKFKLNKYKSTGNHQIQFEARELASGVYYYQLLTKDNSQTSKLLLMK